jgi:hypothetical protein
MGIYVAHADAILAGTKCLEPNYSDDEIKIQICKTFLCLKEITIAFH